MFKLSEGFGCKKVGKIDILLWAFIACCFVMTGCIGIGGNGDGSQVVPGAVLSLQVVSSDSLVSLSWTAPSTDGGSAILGYRIYRGDAADNLSVIANTFSLETTYEDSDVVNGTTYFYAVSSANLVGEGPASNVVSADPGPGASVPGVPLDFSAIRGNARVDLTWSAPSNDGGSDITEYHIYRYPEDAKALSPLALHDILNVDIVPAPPLTYEDKNLINGTEYRYSVLAHNVEGNGPQCTEKSATPITVPGKPTGLTADDGNLLKADTKIVVSASVYLSWTAPTSNGGSAITKYDVYRAEVEPIAKTPVTVPQKIATVENPANEFYTDNGVSYETTYSYYVVPWNIAGDGEQSDSIQYSTSYLD